MRIFALHRISIAYLTRAVFEKKIKKSHLTSWLVITYKQRELWLIFDFKKKQWYEKKLRKNWK